MSAWSLLPNAQHIDRVLASVRSNPHRWADAWVAAWDAARVAAWDAARDATWVAARNAAWDAAWDAARVAARVAARNSVWVAARNALYALIAWDDCAYLLDLPPDAVRLIAASGNDAAVLLLPAVIALHNTQSEDIK